MSPPAPRQVIVPTILVVHGDNRLCELLQLAFGNGGMDVCLAMDAEDAMSQFRRHSPDLVVLDLAIAARGGADFCRLMRGGNSGRIVPLFALADVSPAEAFPQAHEIGAEECLMRPFSAAELMMKARRSLERLEDHRLLESARSGLETSLRKVQTDCETMRRDLNEERSGIQAIVDFNQRIDSNLDRSDVERRGLLQTVALFRTAAACLFQPGDLDSGWIGPVRWHGLVEERIHGVRLPVSGEFLRILSAAGRPLKLEDFERVPGTSWESGILAAAGFTVVAPLIVHSELTGVLALADRTGSSGFGAADIELLGLFSSSLALVLESARIRQGERTITHATVGALVERLEGRHAFLSGHSRRVAALAEALGRHQGLSEREIEDLSMAALLHDIGRTGIDPAAIGRQGPLSPEEWSEMRRHPADGALVAARAGMPEPVRTAILHHHEFWAGGGFPHGLKGRDIPLFARIIAVADCHDALTSARPHRGPLSPEDVQAYFLTQGGVRYDPEIVQSLLALTSGTAANDLARSG